MNKQDLDIFGFHVLMLSEMRDGNCRLYYSPDVQINVTKKDNQYYFNGMYVGNIYGAMKEYVGRIMEGAVNGNEHI